MVPAMTSYAALAPFYEAITGDHSERCRQVRRRLNDHAPAVQSVLELGCGTGLVLSDLRALPIRVGVDLDEAMLAIARDRDPGVDWRLGDMADVLLERTFDVALCVYDTINHLPDLEGWRKFFRGVHSHLAEDGVLIFDVNTVSRLRQLAAMPPWVQDFGSNISIVDIACEDDGDRVRSWWTIRVFTPDGATAGTFTLHNTTVFELGVPIEQILSETDPLFDLLELMDSDGLPATDDSSRAYFVMRRR